jgi:hypothetical protein
MSDCLWPACEKSDRPKKTEDFVINVRLNVDTTKLDEAIATLYQLRHPDLAYDDETHVPHGVVYWKIRAMKAEKILAAQNAGRIN